MTSSNKKHILLLKFVPEGSSDSVKESAKQRAQRFAIELETYWRYHSKGKWDVRVVGDVIESDCQATPPMFCGKFMVEHSRTLTLPEGFEPNYFHALTDVAGTGWCGQATLGGTFGATYRNCNVHTTIHELGHSFGLHHATSETETGESSEYGDDTCVMGSAFHLTGLNSPHMLYLGFEDKREVKYIEQSEQVLLAPIELPPQILHENEYQHLIIKNSKISYYISLRKKKTPYPVKGKEDTLYIHSSTQSMGGSNTKLLKKIKLGETFSRDNFKLKYHEYSNETARLDVVINDQPVQNTVKISDEFPKHISSVELGGKHAGVWADKLYDGQGLDIHIRNGRMLLMWYTMNDSGHRRFFYGTCDLKNGPEEFDIHTSTGGTFERPQMAKVQKVGRGQLYFYDDSHGVFNFNITEFGRGSMSLHPVAYSSDPRNGLWVNPDRDQEGFTIQIFDHVNIATCFWYTYGSSKNSGGQRWFMCSGGPSGDTTYDMKIYEVLNTYGLHTSNPDMSVVGSAKLDTSDGKMKFTYDIDSKLSAIGKDTVELTRLF